MVNLQLASCSSLILHAAAAEHSPAPASFGDPLMAAWLFSCAVLLTLMAALQRRLAAGTLLPGTCRSWEVAIFSDELILHAKLAPVLTWLEQGA